jgi:phosphotransferase system enzyme I (PtsI)
MIASVDELEASREHLLAVCAELGAATPPLGVMIETPAAVAIAQHLASRADFFSIGTNDLMQYTLATDRENERVAGIYDPFHPGVLSEIQRTVDAARDAGIPCSLCGELGGNPVVAPLLVGMGIEELSMAPFAVLALRQVVRRTDASAMADCARDVGSAPRSSDVRERLARTYETLGFFADPDLGALMRHLLGLRVDRRSAPR